MLKITDFFSLYARTEFDIGSITGELLFRVFKQYFNDHMVQNNKQIFAFMVIYS